MADAVQKLYPGAKLGIGPNIKDGFYYDIDLDHPLTEEDLPKIEKKMQEIIKQHLDFKQFFMEKKEAVPTLMSRSF